MRRSKKILVTCHCLLNANAKVYPLARFGGVVTDAMGQFIDSGCGLFQLPCPELSYLGINRWGMTKEQYDHPNFRIHCQDILKFPVLELSALAQAGYELVGILGMDGSPNCGVNLTCKGYRMAGAPGWFEKGRLRRFDHLHVQVRNPRPERELQ